MDISKVVDDIVSAEEAADDLLAVLQRVIAKATKLSLKADAVAALRLAVSAVQEALNGDGLVIRDATNFCSAAEAICMAVRKGKHDAK